MLALRRSATAQESGVVEGLGVPGYSFSVLTSLEARASTRAPQSCNRLIDLGVTLFSLKTNLEKCNRSLRGTRERYTLRRGTCQRRNRGPGTRVSVQCRVTTFACHQNRQSPPQRLRLPGARRTSAALAAAAPGRLWRAMAPQPTRSSSCSAKRGGRGSRRRPSWAGGAP